MDSASTPPLGGNTNRGWELLVEEGVLTPIALITTVIRLIPRVINRQLGWDDSLIIAAMSCRLTSFGFTVATVHAGLGRHQYYLSSQQIMNSIKWTWANEVLIFATICLIKSSICAFILRIRKTKWLQRFLWAVIFLLVLTNAATIIVLLAQCYPLVAYWDRSLGTCWSINIYNSFIYVAVGFSIISDLICTALPVIILWKIRISWRVKIAVCGLMSLGLVASGCAAVRAALATNNATEDLTWNLSPVAGWAFAEADIGIIAANLALARGVYVWIHNRGNTEAYTPEVGSFKLRREGPHQRERDLFKSFLRSTTATQTTANNTLTDDRVPLGESGIVKTVNVDVTSQRQGEHERTRIPVEAYEMQPEYNVSEAV